MVLLHHLTQHCVFSNPAGGSRRGRRGGGGRGLGDGGSGAPTRGGGRGSRRGHHCWALHRAHCGQASEPDLARQAVAAGRRARRRRFLPVSHVTAAQAAGCRRFRGAAALLPGPLCSQPRSRALPARHLLAAHAPRQVGLVVLHSMWVCAFRGSVVPRGTAVTQ